jgi:pyridoxine 5-phosphate synthase
MGNTPGIVALARQVRPHAACLVPENRHEVTTEGGLDCVSHRAALAATIDELHEAGIIVSLFIDPEPRQIETAAELRAEYIELHTGAFANASGSRRAAEREKLVEGARQAHQMGLRVNAGHGLNYENTRELFAVPHLEELNIGHAIVSRALFTGLAAAVVAMKDICADYPG